MGSANHRLGSVTTYPFNVFGGSWQENTPDHMSQLPFKGDIVIGNDVWIGRESTIMPGVKIGDGPLLQRIQLLLKMLNLIVSLVEIQPALSKKDLMMN